MFRRLLSHRTALARSVTSVHRRHGAAPANRAQTAVRDGRTFLVGPGGKEMSFWHDLSLRSGSAYTFVCEIPKKFA